MLILEDAARNVPDVESFFMHTIIMKRTIIKVTKILRVCWMKLHILAQNAGILWKKDLGMMNFKKVLYVLMRRNSPTA